MQTVTYDFPVKMQPLFLADQKPLLGVKAVVRTDTQTPLGVVSDRYRLITHSEALSRVAPFTEALGQAETTHFLEKGGARLVSRFTYRDRTIAIPTVGDTVALRVDITNSYDGSEPLRFSLGGMVLRCLNGMSVMTQGIEFKIRHTGHADMDDIVLPDPEKIWERFVKKSTSWTNWTQLPSSTEYVDRILKQLISSAVIGSKFVHDNQKKLEQASTVWDVYDQLTYAVTHSMPKLSESSRGRRLSALDFAFETMPSAL